MRSSPLVCVDALTLQRGRGPMVDERQGLWWGGGGYGGRCARESFCVSLADEWEDGDGLMAAVFRPRNCPSRVVVAVVIALGIVFLAPTQWKSPTIKDWMGFSRDEIEELKNFLYAQQNSCLSSAFHSPVETSPRLPPVPAYHPYY